MFLARRLVFAYVVQNPEFFVLRLEFRFCEAERILILDDSQKRNSGLKTEKAILLQSA